MREEIEKKLEVKIQVPLNTDEMFLEGLGLTEEVCDTCIQELKASWYQDDFIKALELTELSDSSPHHEYFTIPVKHVSSLIGHYGRRVAGLESRSKASIKIDCTGHVSVFGSKEACERAKADIEDWIKQESNEQRSWHNGFEGRHGQNVQEFEKQYRCMIDLRTAEESKDGMVPVDIIAKETRIAYEAKAGILRFLDRFFPSRDWPDKVELSGPSNNNSAHENASGAKGVTRLTFTVAEEHAPRLIGTRGVNKKRLEEKTDCCLILRTEERRNNIFPVDVIGRNMEECENAKSRILAFLNERPTTSTPPRRTSAPKMWSSYHSPVKFRRQESGTTEDEDSTKLETRGESTTPEDSTTTTSASSSKSDSKVGSEIKVKDMSSVRSDYEEAPSVPYFDEKEPFSLDRSVPGQFTNSFFTTGCFGPLIPSCVAPLENDADVFADPNCSDSPCPNSYSAKAPIGTKTDSQRLRSVFVPEREIDEDRACWMFQRWGLSENAGQSESNSSDVQGSSGIIEILFRHPYSNVALGGCERRLKYVDRYKLLMSVLGQTRLRAPVFQTGLLLSL